MASVVHTRFRWVTSSLAFALFVAGCVASIGDPPSDDEPALESPTPPFKPAPGNLRRLTVEQYRNVIRDLLGPDIIVPTRLEPDARIEGLVAVASGITSFSDRGVEQ